MHIVLERCGWRTQTNFLAADGGRNQLFEQRTADASFFLGRHCGRRTKKFF
jgi:hypothetical protein